MPVLLGTGIAAFLTCPLMGLQHFKKAVWSARTQGPLPTGGHSSIGPSEYPASKMLTYFPPSPQVQRAVPSSTPRWPSPLAKNLSWRQG